MMAGHHCILRQDMAVWRLSNTDFLENKNPSDDNGITPLSQATAKNHAKIIDHLEMVL